MDIKYKSLFVIIFGGMLLGTGLFSTIYDEIFDPLAYDGSTNRSTNSGKKESIRSKLATGRYNNTNGI